MLDPVARMEIQEVHHHEGVCQRRRGYDVDGTLLFQGSRAAYTGKPEDGETQPAIMRDGFAEWRKLLADDFSGRSEIRSTKKQDHGRSGSDIAGWKCVDLRQKGDLHEWRGNLSGDCNGCNGALCLEQ